MAFRCHGWDLTENHEKSQTCILFCMPMNDFVFISRLTNLEWQRTDFIWEVSKWKTDYTFAPCVRSFYVSGQRYQIKRKNAFIVSPISPGKYPFGMPHKTGSPHKTTWAFLCTMLWVSGSRPSWSIIDTGTVVIRIAIAGQLNNSFLSLPYTLVHYGSSERVCKKCKWYKMYHILNYTGGHNLAQLFELPATKITTETNAFRNHIAYQISNIYRPRSY